MNYYYSLLSIIMSSFIVCHNDCPLFFLFALIVKGKRQRQLNECLVYIFIGTFNMRRSYYILLISSIIIAAIIIVVCASIN